MDKVIHNIADGKPAHSGENPDVMDVAEMKSVLGQHLRDAAMPEAEKQRLRDRLRQEDSHERLMDLWREITGQQI